MVDLRYKCIEFRERIERIFNLFSLIEKFVLLDHPTHSLDPNAQTLFWNAMSSEKDGRHILITGQLTDEVEANADRVAVMVDGELKCCGSSIFLKKRFANYRLVCVKSENCKPSATTQLLDLYFPGIAIETETKSQMTYLLSYQKIHKFGRIFEKLEMFYRSLLKLKRFSVSISTAEFVNKEFDGKLEVNVPVEMKEKEPPDGNRCLCGVPLIPCQMCAILMKRFLCGIRHWLSYIMFNAIPVALLIPIAYDIHLRTYMQKANPPSLELSKNTYDNMECFFQPLPSSAEPLQLK